VSTRLPPGPRWPKPVQVIGYGLRPFAFLERCRERYGAQFTLRLATLPTFVILSDPDEARQVFTAPPEVLHPGEGAYALKTLTGANSLNVLDEDAHLEQRRLMLPAFHGEKMRALTGLMTEVAEREVAEWPLGEEIELQSRFRKLTLEVILRTIFGLDPGPRLDALRELLATLITRPAAVVPWLQRDFGPFKVWSRYLALRDQADAHIFELIEERRREGAHRDDVLSMLLEARHEDGSPMSAQELRDQLMTLVVAGHETSATELAWVFAFLQHEPRVVERLVSEIDARDGDAYLTATLHETLRRRPALDPPLPRMVKQPFELGEYTYPPGICVLPSAYLIHHDPSIYPEPHAFRPERFLDEQPGTYTWIGFGGGRRRCIGASFAMVEMKVVVKAVLERVHVNPVGTRVEGSFRQGPTVNPRLGGRVVLTARKRVTAAASREPAAAAS
jgi:cytochrome P450